MREITFSVESKKSERIPAEQLIEQLMAYDVVSFDVFDTLILRPFKMPHDAFLLLSNMYDDSNFYQFRILAEKESRLKNGKIGTYETTIYAIYDEISKYMNIDPELGARNEMNFEKEICYPNPYFKLVYDALRANDKKIIAVSDMYMPAWWITELLHKCNYDIKDVFVSSDNGVNKESSNLFRIAEKSLPIGQYIHIGNNVRADVEGAKKAGWDALHYPTVSYLGSNYRPPVTSDRRRGLSPLMGSAYIGVTNAHLHNGLNKESNYFEFGYKCGGPFTLGYANWIHEQCLERKIDKVLILSRDGYTLKMVYDRLFNDIPSEYAMWSRSTASRLSVNYMPYYFFTQFFYNRRSKGVQFKIKDELNIFKISHLSDKLVDYDLSCDMVIDTKDIAKYDKYISFITDNIAGIRAALSGEDSAMKEYFLELVGDGKNIAIVDMGWTGSSPNVLKLAIEKSWKPDCKAVILLAGVHPKVSRSNPVQLLNKNMSSYMFSHLDNVNEMESFREGQNYMLYFFESLCGVNHPSLYNIEYDEERKIKFIYDIPEVYSYHQSDEIRKGILCFCKEYCERFENKRFMLNFSGSDVLTILKYELSDIESLKEMFGELPYKLGIPLFPYEKISKVCDFLDYNYIKKLVLIPNS